MTIVTLPNEFPAPKFQFGQHVQWRTPQGRREYGIVRGLQYWTPCMSEALFQTLEWFGWSYLIEVDPDFSFYGIEDVHEQDLELRETHQCAA